MKPQVYLDPRPAEYFTKYHNRVRKGRPDYMYRVVRIVLTPIIMLLYRYRAIDVMNVPERGPVLIAAQPLQLLGPLLRGRAAAPGGALHGEVAAVQAPRDRLHHQPRRGVPRAARAARRGGLHHGPHRSSTGAASCSCTARAGVRAPKQARRAQAGCSAGWRWSQACPWCRSRSTAPRTCAASAGSFPKVTVQYGEPIAFEQHPEAHARSSAQEVVGADLRAHPRIMYEALAAQGRRGVLARLRRERRQGAPVTG